MLQPDLIANVLSGYQSFKNIAHYIAKGDRVVVVTSQALKELDAVKQLVALVEECASVVRIVDDVPAEPRVFDMAAIASAIGDEPVDQVIGIGGGSVLDTAKVLAALVQGDLSLEAMLSGTPLSARKGLILIPTTAGTGSEATPNAIFAVPEKNNKAAIISHMLKPDLVILDPFFLESLPKSLIASTGFDALAHCLECFTSSKANPISDFYAFNGAIALLKNIRAVHNDPHDVAAWQKMLFASYCGGSAIAYAGTHIVHLLSYPLGGRYHVPHGVANAMLLVPCFQEHLPSYSGKLAQIASSLFPAEKRADLDMSKLLMNYIEDLSGEFELPTSFAGCNLPSVDVDGLITDAMTIRRLIENSPVPITPEDAKNIYSQFA
ncbi:iron-containing alcohol dehydrogenase [Marinobacterium rhizophilum]|uniref:iron-containing alcohol dehydrogenase n=1 Tax=Marinobacterium rhizophilum TaxID=420402 RepID=UPI000368456B|nr:iron-containing alcohol dehydrogenase [Marinobacterium rhizophilum]